MGRSSDGPDQPSEDGTPSDGDGQQHPRYLFPVDGDQSSAIIDLVCDLVADADAELFVAAPVVLPDQTPLDALEPAAEGRRRAADFVMKIKQQCDGTRRIESVVEVGRDRATILQDVIDRYSISTVVTEDQPRAGIRSLLGFESVDDVGLTGNYNRIVVSRIEPIAAIDSVLAPIARGPHSGLAIDTGLAIARQHDASLELLHVYETDDDEARRRGEEVLDKGLQRAGSYADVERTLRASTDVTGSIIEYTASFDITVLGAPREGRLRQFVLGSIPDEVTARADRTTLIAHCGGTDESWLDRWF